MKMNTLHLVLLASAANAQYEKTAADNQTLSVCTAAGACPHIPTENREDGGMRLLDGSQRPPNVDAADWAGASYGEWVGFCQTASANGVSPSGLNCSPQCEPGSQCDTPNRGSTNSHLFIPYGTGNGDTDYETVHPDGRCDDCHVHVPISAAFKIYGVEHSDLYVSTNGLVTFESGFDSYTSQAFPIDNLVMLSAYWTDADLRIGGKVFYREIVGAGQTGIDQWLKNAVTHDYASFVDTADEAMYFTMSGADGFHSSWNFIVTWHEVGLYGATCVDRANTFQAVLTMGNVWYQGQDLGQYSFATYHYGDIEWTTGRASASRDCAGLGGTPAQTGFNDGAGNFFQLDLSQTEAIVNIEHTSNVATTGRYVFRVDREHVSAPTLGNDYLTDQPQDLLGDCCTASGYTLDDIPNYGCWCQITNDGNLIRGTPIDGLDQLCSKLARCLRCNRVDGCPIDFTAVVNGSCEEVVCSASNNACQAQNCECHRSFSIDVENWLQGNSMNPDFMNVQDDQCPRNYGVQHSC